MTHRIVLKSSFEGAYGAAATDASAAGASVVSQASVAVLLYIDVN